jgi:hypothetical protein
MREEASHGQSRPDLADLSSESGWVATDVAARAVRVSPRTIRRYIEQGKLEATLEGEGVRREWLVSVDSLHALRATRTFEDSSPDADRVNAVATAAATAANIADVLRDMAARLERRAEEAAELRVRLEITERAQSTLDQERRQALGDLEETRRRLDETERERDELRRELDALKESYEEAPEPPETPPEASAPTDASAEAQEASERQEERKGWLRRFFGL